MEGFGQSGCVGMWVRECVCIGVKPVRPVRPVSRGAFWPVFWADGFRSDFANPSDPSAGSVRGDPGDPWEALFGNWADVTLIHPPYPPYPPSGRGSDQFRRCLPGILKPGGGWRIWDAD
jgi:hypothetical protein